VQVQGQRAESGQQRPDQRHQQETLAHAHFAFPPAHGNGEQDAGRHRDQHGFVVGAVGAVAGQPGNAERNQHQDAEANDQDAENVEHCREAVDHEPPPCLQEREPSSTAANRPCAPRCITSRKRVTGSSVQCFSATSWADRLASASIAGPHACRQCGRAPGCHPTPPGAWVRARIFLPLDGAGLVSGSHLRQDARMTITTSHLPAAESIKFLRRHAGGPPGRRGCMAVPV